MSIQAIKVAASGAEIHLMIRAGIDSKTFNGKNQPCLFCGGTDRAWWNKNGKYEGTYGCRQCGNHDWIKMINHVQGIPLANTLSWIESELGIKNMDSDKREELSKIARRRQEVMEAKAKLKQENQHWDFNIAFEMNELHLLMKERGSEKMVGIQEMVQMQRAAKLLNQRLASIITSSSMKKAKTVFDELSGMNPSVSNEVIDYANVMKENNVFGLGDHVFAIMVVRQMLIEKKDKLFMAGVIKSLLPNENVV